MAEFALFVSKVIEYWKLLKKYGTLVQLRKMSYEWCTKVLPSYFSLFLKGQTQEAVHLRCDFLESIKKMWRILLWYLFWSFCGKCLEHLELLKHFRRRKGKMKQKKHLEVLNDYEILCKVNVTYCVESRAWHLRRDLTETHKSLSVEERSIKRPFCVYSISWTCKH